MSRVIDEGQKLSDFDNFIGNKAFVSEAIKHALNKIDKMISDFDTHFPSVTTNNNIYSLRKHEDPQFKLGDNFGWTTSFWTGMLWLSYELTMNSHYKKIAETHVESFKRRIEKQLDCNHHDLGFLYTLSCISAVKLTGNMNAKHAAIEAAEALMNRYYEEAGIIQAWGDLDDPEQRGRIIIDSLMNLSLLYWTAEETGDLTYYKAAVNHANQARQSIVREDASTYHTYYFDPDTGKGIYGKTHQGYSDSSCWARGQAWGIYGFALSYRHTKDPSFLEISKKVANYFLNRLPEDYVPYWDLNFNAESGEERDSSAASIAVCGLFELADHLDNKDDRQYYQNAAWTILQSLYNNYSTKDDDRSNALLMHAVYAKPVSLGIDEACLWGDYFYLEALTRVSKDWDLYW